MSFVPLQHESIAHATEEAIKALTALHESNQNLSTDDEGSVRRYDDEIERLEIWIHEHGVREGKLDHKLRESSGVHHQVLSLLEELSGTTDESVRLDSNAESLKRAGLEPPFFPRSSVEDDSNLSVRSASLSLDTNLSVPGTRPDTPLTHIRDVVGLLMELGPTLLDPTPHNRFGTAAHPEAAQHDINHVRASFPRADDRLVKRLGKANWERRHYLMNLRPALEQHSPEAGSFDAVSTEAAAQDDKLESLSFGSDSEESEGIESGLLHQSWQHKSDAASSDNDRSDQDGQTVTDQTSVTMSQFQFSETGKPSTAFTSTTSIDIAKEVTPHARNIPAIKIGHKLPSPPRPNELLSGDEFTCPFCAYKVSGIDSVSAWKKHVFNDLEPYMCTCSECTSYANTYGRKSSWWRHETDRHRTHRSWVCTPCSTTFDTSKSFENHVAEHHPNLTSTQILNIRDMCQKEDDTEPPSEVCPLCLETVEYKRLPKVSKSRAFERAVKHHVSRHLEQLSLFVAFSTGYKLLEQDDSGFQDDSDTEDYMQSEIKSIVSRDTHLSKREIHVANVKAFIADQKKAAHEPYQSKTSASIAPSVTPGECAEEEPALSPLKEAPTFPVYVQMPPPNEHFYSRSGLLQGLDKALASPGHICIVHGVGGVGKTLAAVEYSHDHMDRYDAIFWCQADTAPGLTDSYFQMAMAVGVADSPEDQFLVTAKGRSWLQETDKRWLLVFDNTVNWEDISRYIPNSFRRTKGSVLITTQNEKLLSPAANLTKLRINPLNQQSGSQMLLKYLGRDVDNDPEKHLAKEISVFVGGLPVAIAHVAGYVSYSGYSLEELIETFREWRKRTGVATDEADDLPATFREASFSYDGALTMVWEVTLRELTQDARDVLNLLGYLNCTSVPRDMIWTMHSDPILSFLDPREKIRMRRIHQSLTKRRLIVDSEGSFSMHRSLQQGIRDKLSQDKGQQQTVFDQAVALVREVFPLPNELQQPTPDRWSERQKLLPHLHALHDVYHGSKHQINGSVEFAQLLLDAGMDQFEQGIVHEGLLLLHTAEVVLEASDSASSEEHQVMKANIHAMIAIMYDDVGIEKRQEAMKRRETALHVRRATFEESPTKNRKDEILLYNSWMEYAISLLHYHRYIEAEPIIEKCLAKFREWDPEDKIPFEYAKYYNKIALVRMYQGRFDEAIDLATKGVKLMIKTGYHLFTSRFKFDQACIVLQSGDLERALHIHEEIHEQRIEMVGPVNPLSLHSMYAIGAIYELKADLFEAENWFRKVLDQRRVLTSWPDEAHSRTQYHLAKVLEAQGKQEDANEAAVLRESALETLHRLLPLDFPPELKNVTDEAILFDHMLPISPGGPRFTGKGLLERFMRKI